MNVLAWVFAGVAISVAKCERGGRDMTGIGYSGLYEADLPASGSDEYKGGRGENRLCGGFVVYRSPAVNLLNTEIGASWSNEVPIQVLRKFFPGLRHCVERVGGIHHSTMESPFRNDDLAALENL
jgi:hypothetical protein